MIISPRHSFILLTECVVLLFVLFGCSGQEATGTSPPAIAGNAAPSESSGAAESSDRSPRIVFDETTHDFGEQISGSDLEKTFAFRNEGDGTLIVENVKAG
jgi:hypothetical protein